MKIAIVDDVSNERELLRGRLEHQLNGRNICAELLEYDNGEDFLASTRENKFTILFLDIYMDGADGIEIAREFRKQDKNCFLIFTTTSRDHALEGFQVRAMHYLVKPYTEEDLSVLLDEIFSRISIPDKYIEIKVSGSEVRVPLKEIVYAEHFSHMIHIHTTSAKVLITRQSFETFTTPLKRDTRFFVCNRGIIVNLEHAVDFDGVMFLLDDGSAVSVSRKLLKDAKQTFMNFLFQRGHT